MSKKTTEWITIPENRIHTPAEADAKRKKGKSGTSPVKNKWLWAIGFAVLTVAVVAVLAPTQFNELIQGNLFSGVQTQEGIAPPLSPRMLLPGGNKKETAPAEGLPEESMVAEETGTAEAPSADATADTEDSEAIFQGSAVKPEEEAVSISVKPVSTKLRDCAEISLSDLAECKRVSCKTDLGLGEMFGLSLKVVGMDVDHCLVEFTYDAFPIGSLTGKGGTCRVAKADFTDEDFAENMEVDFGLRLTRAVGEPGEQTLEAFEANCSGPIVDEIRTIDEKARAEAMEAEKEKAKADAQALLIAELQKKIGDMEQGLTEPSGTPLYGSATDLYTTTGATPGAIQPQFRPNTHRVAISPQEVLNRNIASGGTYDPSLLAAQTGGSQPSVPVYTSYPSQQVPSAYATAQPVVGGTTPQSGPTEAIFVAMLAVFLGLVVWKFRKLFIA